MPTTLPVRGRPIHPTEEFGDFLRALLRMYAVIAGVIGVLITTEAACGAFAGQPLAASILTATDTDWAELSVIGATILHSPIPDADR